MDCNFFYGNLNNLLTKNGYLNFRFFKMIDNPISGQIKINNIPVSL